jgi:LPXTG-motif cell wall-anchored protein
MKIKVIFMILLAAAFLLTLAAGTAVAQNNQVCSTCDTWDTSAPFSVDAPDGSVVSEVWIEVAEPQAPTAVPNGPQVQQISPCLGPFTSDGVVGEGCYEIVGIGTGNVTVTIVNDCLDIAHIEVCFTPVAEAQTVQENAYTAVQSLPSTGLMMALPAAGLGFMGAGALFLKRRRR